MLVLVLALGLVAGFLAAERPAVAAGQAARRPRAARRRWRWSRCSSLIALASAPGGVDGQVSKAWNQLTNPNASTPDNSPGRFTEASSVRARYWDEAFKVHGLSPAVGTGAGAYATVRNRFRTGRLYVRHAHGYVPQTLADLGWVGLGLSLLALCLWALGRRRCVIGLRRRDRGLPWDAERVGMVTLAAIALVFGVHSAVDWTWFVPAQRADRPGRRGVGRGAAVAAHPHAGGRARRSPCRRPCATARATPRRCGRRRRRPRPRRRRRRRRARARCRSPTPSGAAARRSRGSPSAVATMVVAFALAAAWTAVQPLRSVNAGDAAIERLQAGRARGRGVDRADRARPQPALARAAVGARLHRAAARAPRQRRRTRSSRPSGSSPRTPRRGAGSAASSSPSLNQPADALASFRAAYFLDPRNPASTSDFLEASRANGQPAALPPASP